MPLRTAENLEALVPRQSSSVKELGHWSESMRVGESDADRLVAKEVQGSDDSTLQTSAG